MDNKIIDAKFIEVDSSSKKYSTIEEVSEIISVDVPTIIFWYNKFNYFLNIQTIGMYQIFNENDIKNLKTIKNLIDNGMTINDIRQYLNNNKEIIIQKKEIEVPEVSLLTVIAKILSSQNEKIETLINSHEQILNLNKQLINNQEQFLNRIGESQREICTDIENRTNNIMENQDKLHKEEVKSLKNDISKLNKTVNDKINSIERANTKALLEREELLQRHMEERKKQKELIQQIELEHKNKPLWKRILKK